MRTQQHVPHMNSADRRNTMQNEVVQQAAQDPMQQIMQLMQMYGQQQQMQQQQEDSPLQMALKQIQMEAAQQNLQQGQQQLQQGAQMFPLELAQRQAMIDYYNQRAVDPMAALAPGQEQPQVDLNTLLSQKH